MLITPKELNVSIKNNDKLVVLDIREAYEREICKIDSIHIPMGSLSIRVSELPEDKMIVVLCKSGRRAAAVANLLLTEYSFNDVKILDGGILAWILDIDSNLNSY